MKTIKITTLLLFISISLASFTSNTATYVGKWKGEDKGDIGYMTFTEDNYASFNFNGKIMGGKSYTQNGIKASMKYSIDNNSVPNKIDFIISNNTTKKEMGRLKGIIKMISDDKIELSMGFGKKERPKNFETDALVFSRVK